MDDDDDDSFLCLLVLERPYLYIHPWNTHTKQYETWERGINEHGARTTLPTLQPGFNQARQIARERRTILDSQKLDK